MSTTPTPQRDFPFRPSAARARVTALNTLLPPAMSALLLLDQLRPGRQWHFSPDSPQNCLWQLLLDLEGPLATYSMRVLQTLRPQLGERGFGMRIDELERLCWFRQLQSVGRRGRLRELLDEEITRADHGRRFHSEVLHLFASNRHGNSKIALKAMERECMLRGAVSHDWRYFRAQYNLAHQQGQAQECLQISQEAKDQGVYFDPQQLRGNGQLKQAAIRDCLDFSTPGALTRVMECWQLNNRINLHIHPANWTHLRRFLLPLMSSSSPLMEIHQRCLPLQLPNTPGDSQFDKATLVIRLDPQHKIGQEDLPLGNWRIVLLNPSGKTFAGYVDLQSPLVPGLRHSMSGKLINNESQVMPLKAFVSQLESRYIQEVLQLHKGVKIKACESLGIARQTLYSKLTDSTEDWI